MQPSINVEENRFHTTDIKHAEYTKNTIIKALNEERITQDDVRLITEFVTEVAVTGNIKPCRKYKTYLNSHSYKGIHARISILRDR